MGLFDNHFPYTSYQNLNLDQIADSIGTCKTNAAAATAAAEDAEEFASAASEAKEDAEQAKEDAEAAAASLANGSPVVVTQASDMTDTDIIYLYMGSEAGYIPGNWYYYDGSWVSGGTYGGLANGSVTGRKLSTDIRNALKAIFRHVAFKDDDANTYYTALVTALDSNAVPVRISAVYTPDILIFTDEPLDLLRSGLVVNIEYSDGVTEATSDYTLSGDLTAGTSVITVAYQGFTTTVNVNVTAWTSSWDYSDNGLPSAVYPNDWGESMTDATAVYEANEGIKVTVNANTWGIYTLSTEAYTTTTNGVIEFVASYANFTSGANISGRLSSNDCIIGFLVEGGVRVNAWANDLIDGTAITANTDHVLRVERTLTEGKVYLDGKLVYSGALRNLSGTNSIIISTAAKAATAAVVYLRAARFYNA